MFERLKNLFRKGGVSLGLIDSLTSITDHPKIGVDPSEYDRIEFDRQYFTGEFPKVEYKNSNGLVKNREYISLNMLQVICRRMASIVFNEQCKINIAGDTKRAEYIKSVLKNNDFEKNFERYLESMFAMGGLAIRPYWDKQHEKIKLSWAQAPLIFPLKSNTNDISDIAIASHIQRVEGNKTVYYTLLEFHEWSEDKYVITNELYRSEDKTIVGTKVAINTLYDDMSIEATYSDHEFSRPQVVYLKPAGFNNKNIVSPLGLGLGTNARQTLKQINDATDQFYWEIKMGQRRVAVSSAMVRGKVDPKTGVAESIFDTDDNVFITFNGNATSLGDPFVKDLTTPIRTDDYVKAINNLIKKLEIQVGFSSGTFSFNDNQGVKTATEIVSENSMTFQTRNSQVSQIERAIQELVIAISELAKVNGQFAWDVPTIDDITIDLDDGVFNDKQAQLDYWAQRVSSGLATKAMALQAIDDLSSEEAKKVAAEIDGETINATPPEPTPQFDPTKDDG